MVSLLRHHSSRATWLPTITWMKVKISLPKLVVAIADFVAEDKNQLSFNEGDELLVLNKNSSIWWWAELDEKFGYVPVSYVVPVSEYLSRHVQNHDWQDEEYFGAYGKVKIHLEMLSDHSRTLAYRNAIF